MADSAASFEIPILGPINEIVGNVEGLDGEMTCRTVESVCAIGVAAIGLAAACDGECYPNWSARTWLDGSYVCHDKKYSPWHVGEYCCHMLGGVCAASEACGRCASL